MPVSVQTVPPLAIARSVCGNNMGLASVEPTAKQHVGPDHEPAIGLVSDLGLRGMIEAWFELERMKSNLVPGPDTARMFVGAVLPNSRSPGSTDKGQVHVAHTAEDVGEPVKRERIPSIAECLTDRQSVT
jgi:hypothetical protein